MAQYSRNGRRYFPGEDFVRRTLLRLGVVVASIKRRRLDRTTFIGITGSAAKTTTKTLLVSLLGPGTTSPPRGSNRLATDVKLIVRTRRSDAFCVAEVAAWRPGSVAEKASLLRPDVAIVTRIGLDHHKAFRTLEGVAGEKGALVAALPADGIAVLNADDPYVMEMAEGFPGRVVTFGVAPTATLRAEGIRSSWPDPLELTLHVEGRSLPVRTRLHGKQSATAVLAALAGAHSVGVPLEEAIAKVADFEAVTGRMCPVAIDGGIAFIRDDNKAPVWALEPLLEFVGDSRATRTILVIGTLSDYPGSTDRVYRALARRALAVADEVAFVGPQAHQVRKLVPESGGALRVFPTVRAASEHFLDDLRDGDLVVLKGSNRADHLARILLARTTGVDCWRESCRRRRFCDTCDLLHTPG